METLSAWGGREAFLEYGCRGSLPRPPIDQKQRRPAQRETGSSRRSHASRVRVGKTGDIRHRQLVDPKIETKEILGQGPQAENDDETANYTRHQHPPTTASNPAPQKSIASEEHRPYEPYRP